ncbi:MAG: Uma2 family endonuclease [Dehalococcoidia bacterium]
MTATSNLTRAPLLEPGQVITVENFREIQNRDPRVKELLHGMLVIEPPFPMTVEDWHNLPDDDPNQYELLHGMLIMCAAPSGVHQDAVTNIATDLAMLARSRGGWVRTAPQNVDFAERIGFQPDIMYLAPESMFRRGRHGVNGPPDLIVEVLSPSTAEYDRGVKLPSYFHYGVREVWLVDVDKRVVELRWADGPPVTVAFGETIPSEIVEIGSGHLELVPSYD